MRFSAYTCAPHSAHCFLPGLAGVWGGNAGAPLRAGRFLLWRAYAGALVSHPLFTAGGLL